MLEDILALKFKFCILNCLYVPTLFIATFAKFSTQNFTFEAQTSFGATF